jgi:hypothetical protein
MSPLCLLGSLAALAAPMDDPTARLADQALRGSLGITGAPGRDPLSLAWRLHQAAVADDPLWGELLGVELRAIGGAPASLISPRGGLIAGGLPGEANAGDDEAGALSLRAGAEVAGYRGPVSVRLGPTLGQELEPLGSSLAFEEAWVGVRSPGLGGQLTADFGLRPRWRGPGRFGALLLSEHARPAPAGGLGYHSDPGRLGALSAEATVGWLDGERRDVAHPGWLFLDLRYRPLPYLELGAGRSALFGGEGRPAVNIAQLLIPTEPHVYDDPDARSPDQNELAALDARLWVPWGRWVGHDEAGLSLWWEYGAEDVIAQESLGIPYPSLAGVANLGGAELGWGPWSLVAERAELLDDYFRWYSGHRIYHQGFVREGRAMGHPAGGDAQQTTLLAGYQGEQWGLDLWGQSRRRVGVVEAEGERLWALATDETRQSLGLRASHRTAGARRWWQASLEVARVEGLDFVPGTEGTLLRASVGLR